MIWQIYAQKMKPTYIFMQMMQKYINMFLVRRIKSVTDVTEQIAWLVKHVAALFECAEVQGCVLWQTRW